MCVLTQCYLFSVLLPNNLLLRDAQSSLKIESETGFLNHRYFKVCLMIILIRNYDQEPIASTKTVPDSLGISDLPLKRDKTLAPQIFTLLMNVSSIFWLLNCCCKS